MYKGARIVSARSLTSKNGAKIITEEQVPNRFQLAFFQGGENRVCEVIWRRAKMLGVKFIF